jgi:anti-sigma factor RsiW
MTASADQRRHLRIQELLPWWVNGTLEEAEAAEVAEHLETCAPCREEEGRCRRLGALVAAAEEIAPVPHPTHLERLLSTIAEEEGGGRRRRWNALGLPRWLQATPATARWLLAAQGLAVLALAAGLTVVLFAPRASDPSAGDPVTVEEPAQFRALADPEPVEPSRPALRVVYSPGTAEAEIRDLLLELGAEIVGGPTRLGSYTIAVPGGVDADPVELVLDHLRGSPMVRLAEPVAAREAMRSPR